MRAISAATIPETIRVSILVEWHTKNLSERTFTCKLSNAGRDESAVLSTVRQCLLQHLVEIPRPGRSDVLKGETERCLPFGTDSEQPPHGTEEL